MSSGKPIQITSNLDVQAESLHEKIVDPDTGKAKVIDKGDPHSVRESTTVTSNPVTYEAKGTEAPRVVAGKAEEIDPATLGYDSSQL